MADVSQSATSDRNFLTSLTSLNRMSARDQQRLAARLHVAAHEAKKHGAIQLAASLLRAVYELEKV